MWPKMMRAVVGAERAGRLDERLVLEREHLPAHDARHGQPLHRAQRDEQHEQALGEEHQQQDDEEDVRQRVEHVDDAHHELVDLAADVARDRAVADADEDRHQRADRARPAARCGRRRCVRASMSRPSRSVPSGCAHDGPVDAEGEVGARSGRAGPGSTARRRAHAARCASQRRSPAGDRHAVAPEARTRQASPRDDRRAARGALMPAPRADRATSTRRRPPG